MKTDNLVKIGNEYYAPNHPLVKGKHGVPTNWHYVSDSNVYIEPTRRTLKETLNKTERTYLQILQARFPNGYVQAHTIKLQLAEKCWYTPDFSYVLPSGALVFVETKGGFERDDAIVKLKTAARQFPQFTFIKAKYLKGKWTETVMPK